MATPKKTKEPQVDLLLDLQDIDFSSPVSPGQANSVQEEATWGAPRGNDGGGLLANMEIRVAPQEPEVTTTAPPSTR